MYCYDTDKKKSVHWLQKVSPGSHFATRTHNTHKKPIRTRQLVVHGAREWRSYIMTNPHMEKESNKACSYLDSCVHRGPAWIHHSRCTCSFLVCWCIHGRSPHCSRSHIHPCLKEKDFFFFLVWKFVSFIFSIRLLYIAVSYTGIFSSLWGHLLALSPWQIMSLQSEIIHHCKHKTATGLVKLSDLLCVSLSAVCSVTQSFQSITGHMIFS